MVLFNSQNSTTVNSLKTMQQTDFIDIRSQVKAFDLTLPECILVLPDNIESAIDPSEFIYSASAPTVLKLFRKSDDVGVLALTEEPLTTRRDHDYTIVFPILFFGATYLSQNPDAISITLNIISNYITQMLQGIPSGGKVKLSIAIEKTKSKTTTKIDYDGSPSGLPEILKIVEQLDGKE